MSEDAGGHANGDAMIHAWVQTQSVYHLLEDMRSSWQPKGPYPEGVTTSEAQMTWDCCETLIDAVPPTEPHNGFEATIQSARRVCVAVRTNPPTSPLAGVTEADYGEWLFMLTATDPARARPKEVRDRTWLGRLVDRMGGK